MTQSLVASTSPHVRATLTVLDQATSSLSNVLVVFLAVRTMSTSDFGLLSAAMVACTALLMVSRATLGSSVAFAAADGLRGVADEARVSMGVLVLLGPACFGLVLFTAWVVAGDYPPAFVWIVALTTPVVLVQDQLRFAASAAKTPGTALAADVLWVAIVLAIPITSAYASTPWTTTSLLGAWAAGALLASALLVARLRLLPSIRGLRHWVATTGRARLQTATGASIRAVSGVARLSAIGALAGTAVLGALSAGQLLMTPLNLLAALIPFGLAPIAARRQMRGGDSRRIYVGAGALLGAVALGWGVICALIPEDVGAQLLGPSWDAAESLIWPMTVMSSAILVTTAGFYALLSAGQSHHYMRVQVLFAALSLGAAVAIAALDGSTATFAWTEAAVVWLVAALTWAPVRRVGPWPTQLSPA